MWIKTQVLCLCLLLLLYSQPKVSRTFSTRRVDSADTAVELRGCTRAPALSLCCHLTLSWSPLSHNVFLASPLDLYQVKKILQDVCFILFGQSVLSIFSASVERPLPTCSWLTRLETRCFSLFETTNGCPIKTCGPQSQTQQPCEPRTG